MTGCVSVGQQSGLPELDLLLGRPSVLDAEVSTTSSTVLISSRPLLEFHFTAWVCLVDLGDLTSLWAQGGWGNSLSGHH